MSQGMPASELEEMLETFPDLVELYPLQRFLGAVLDELERLSGASPVACYVPMGRVLCVRGDGSYRAGTVPADSALGKDEPAVVRPFGLGESAAAGMLADVGELRVVPALILDRPTGFFLVPARAAADSRRLSLLARLTGFYLHRHEVEVRIGDRFARELVIMGYEPWIFRLQEDVERFSALREPIVILGESGSGKEIVAETIHVLSPRREKPFVAVNCAAAPSENLLLDEFFGHRRGAFTGAAYDKEGCCQEADGGTLFLDEIGDMSHELQTLLLRTLTTGEVRRVGDEQTTRVDIRLVSATHRDLLKATGDRSFRADLYYRISAFQLQIPPLRERRGDIAFLADYVIHRFAAVNGLPPKTLTDAAKRKLREHPWLGNVRELENVLKRAFVLAGEEIDVDDIRLDGRAWPQGSPADDILGAIRRDGKSFWEAVAEPFMRRQITRDVVSKVLEEGRERAGGRISRMAADFHLEPGEYARFVAFLHRHGFRGRLRGDSPEADDPRQP